MIFIRVWRLPSGCGRAQAQSAERGALQRDVAREPPLEDGAHRHRGGGDPEDLRREIVAREKKPEP